jgi:hypothetical protein
MVEPINLRQFRKRKNRADKERQAEENRKTFGVSTKNKKSAKANERLAQQKLDGTKLDKKD